MNVSPVSILNFNSYTKNSNLNNKDTKEASANENLSLNSNPIRVSASLLQAYNPQISFKGIESLMSDEEQDRIVDFLSIQSDDDSKETNAHILAKTEPERYINATKDLSPMRKIMLLTLSDDSGNTVAHELTKSDTKEKTSYCLEATKDLDTEERYEVLKRRNGFGSTVAHYLAANNVHSYAELTKDFPKKTQIALLKAFNSTGWSVAHNVVSSNADVFNTITRQFTPDEKFDILSQRDEYEYSVAHTLAHRRESSFPVITRDLSPKQKFDILMLTSDVTGTVAQNLYNRNPEMLEFTMEGIPAYKKAFIGLS